MQFSLYMWFFSLLPIATLLFLMSYVKLEAKKSALFSLILPFLIAIFLFGMSFNQLWLATKKGMVLSLYVILIIIGAVFLYNVVEISKGFESIKKYMTNIEANKDLIFISLCWTFSAFVQGITGFGVPVAIVGALLTGIGYNSIISLSAVLVGHSWAISFGSMGSSFFALKLVTNLESIRLGIILASLFYLPIITTGIFVTHIYGGFSAIKKNLKFLIPIAIFMGTMQLAAAAFGFPHIGSLLGGLVGTGCFLLIILKFTKNKIKNQQVDNRMSYLEALFPYILLVVLVLVFQIPIVSEMLPELKMEFSFPGFTTDLGYEVKAEKSFSTISLFSHPILFLILSSLFGGGLYIYKGFLNINKTKKIFTNTYLKAQSSVITVFLLMIMALIMDNSGMIFMFANGMAKVSGFLFPLISPFIGVLGAFLTGSNTSSNVLFGAFQKNTANILNFSPNIIASTQSIGGSLGSAIAPAKVLLGTSVVGIQGKEGDIIKKGLGYTLLSSFLIGIIVIIVELFI